MGVRHDDVVAFSILRCQRVQVEGPHGLFVGQNNHVVYLGLRLIPDNNGPFDTQRVEGCLVGVHQDGG